jgi:HAD domain in Swiss Army Knife RNA repair proteins
MLTLDPPLPPRPIGTIGFPKCSIHMSATCFRSNGSENDLKSDNFPLLSIPPADPNRSVIKRPVIFLDVDGVLNRSADVPCSNEHGVATELLARFKTLVTSANARVVLASTWRHETGGLRKARELGIPFEDVLPDLRPHSRGTEVKAWLADHPNVERFAIIDDDDDGYEDMPLFQPNPYKGLSGEVAAAVAEFFAGIRDDDYRRSLPIRSWDYLKSFFEGHRG